MTSATASSSRAAADAEQRAEPHARALVLVLLPLLALWAWHARIGLAADGAAWLLSIGDTGEFLIANPFRRGVLLPVQFPLWLAMQAGVRDPSQLLAVHVLGLVGVPAATWWLAIWLQRRGAEFWLLTLAWGVVVLNTALVAHGEFNLAYALAALCASLLLVPAPRPGWQRLLLLGVSFLLLRAYETQLFLGPILALAAWRQRHESEGGNRLALTLAAALLTLGALLALQALLSSRNPSQVRESLNPLVLVHIEALVVSTLVVGLVLVRRLPLALPLPDPLPRWTTALAAIPALPFCWSRLEEFFEARLAVGVLLGALLGLMLLRPATALPGGWRAMERRVILVLLAALALPFAVRSGQFGAFVQAVRASVQGQQGTVAVEGSAVEGSPFVWPWALPALSIVVQEAPYRAILAPPASYDGWVAYGGIAQHPPRWPRPR